MTLNKWGHDPFVLGNDSSFRGSWRLQVDFLCLSISYERKMPPGSHFLSHFSGLDHVGGIHKAGHPLRKSGSDPGNVSGLSVPGESPGGDAAELVSGGLADLGCGSSDLRVASFLL